MGITVDHGSQEFSDLSMTDDGLTGVTGLTWPSMVALAFIVHVRLVISSLVRLHGPGMGVWLKLKLDEAKAERAMEVQDPSLHDYPAMPPRVHPSTAVRSLGANRASTGTE